MPTPSRKRDPKPARRRALELLAASRDGCSEALLIAHGFTVPQVVDIINAGLATATDEYVIAGNRKIEVARVRITEAGRRVALFPWTKLTRSARGENHETAQGIEPNSQRAQCATVAHLRRCLRYRGKS
jgi:hypothetical protein